MKEIKLKLFYVICIPVFILINTHAFVWFAKISKPLSVSGYYIQPDLVEYSFLGMVVYTMIASVGNIFFIKKTGREKAGWFLVMMVTDTILLLVAAVITILIFNIQKKILPDAGVLFNGVLLLGLYTVKQSLFIFFFSRKRPAEQQG